MSSYPDVQMQSVLDHIRKYSNENSENSSSNNIQNVLGYLLEKWHFLTKDGIECRNGIDVGI